MLKFLRHGLLSGITALLCFSSTPFANNELPELGDPSLQDFSSRTEKAYGELFYRTLRANADFVDDELVQHYLVSLGEKLATHSDATDANFKFFLIKSDTINAFAGPDAHIGINSGLLLRAKNESELAGVIAHEIAHVSQRHLARMYSRQGSTAAISLGAIIAAILVSAQSPDAAQALIASGVAGSYQTSINFTRQNEYEADRIGMAVLTDAGIDPRGMVGFFRTLLEESQGLQIEYLRTHPLNVNRVSEAENRIEENKLTGRTDTIDFRLAKARVQVLTSPDPGTLLLTESDLDEVHLIYRQALVRILLNDNAAAIERLQQLQSRSKHPWLTLALAEAFTQAGEIDKALELTGRLVKLYPGYLPATLAHARLVIEKNGDLQQVITLLKHQLQTDNKVGLHKLLARAYFLNGQISAALESTGNQYLLEGYKELALQQFENAQNQKDISDSARQRLQKKISLLKPELDSLQSN